MLMLCLLLIAAAFLVSAPATCAARAVGRKLNALDSVGVPGQVKAPPRWVPNTGGIGIFLGILVPLAAGLVYIWNADQATFVTGWLKSPALAENLEGLKRQAGAAAVLVAALGVLHVLGLIDDRRALGPRLKFAVMGVSAAAVVVLTDSRLLTMADAYTGGRWLSVLLTVLWIIVITNAFNFLDNMDGLSGGVAALCAACFLTIALLNHPPQIFIAAALSVLLGSVLGFLLFNFPFRARGALADGTRVGGASIFMGDGGSLVIGFMIAVLSVRITYAPAFGALPSPHLLLTPLIVLAIPLYDFCSVVLIRTSQGRSPFVGDLQHFSHRLARHGLSARTAVLVIYGCTIVTGIGAIAMPRLEPWQGYLVGLQTLAVLGVLALYEYARSPKELPRP